MGGAVPSREWGGLTEALRDGRGGRVVFVSHCLLNENVRYLGGACRPAAVDDLVDAWRQAGIGICQMPCPEQQAWGGVLKPRMLSVYGSKGSLRYALRRPLTALLLAWTRRVYRRLARRVAEDIASYRDAGMDVTGIVAVAGSPSCGAAVTIDVPRAVERLAALPLATLDRDAVNRVVIETAVPGTGMFIAALLRCLRRRGIEVPVTEHDLIAELRSDESALASGGTRHVDARSRCRSAAPPAHGERG